jgi:hypothetical protein
MQVEDFLAHSCRNISEICLNSKELRKILNDLKLVLRGRLEFAVLSIPGVQLKIRTVDTESKDYPDKGFVSAMQRKLTETSLKDKISLLESENYFLTEINMFCEKEQEVIQEMFNQFKIVCADPINEVHKFIPTSQDLIKEAALQVEVKNYTSKNKALEKTQKDIEWQLNEVKILKQHLLGKISELNEYKKEIEKQAKIVEPSTYNPPLIREQKKRQKREPDASPDPEVIEETTVLNSKLMAGIELSSHELQVPVPSYKNVTLESLQEHLRFLEDKASTSTPNEKLMIEIERCKTKITNKRGEQAIQDCKIQTKTMFKKFETIEKTVKKENQKRGKLIKQLLRDSNGDSESLKQEIQESLSKSLMKLEEKAILKKRSGNNENFNEDGYNLNELRTQINALFKFDMMIKKNLEKEKIKIEAKQLELKQREKFLLENWKKNYSAKEIIEILQKVTEKLAREKEKMDKEKFLYENEKKNVYNRKLENELEKGKLKTLANQIYQEKKYVENEKNEIIKFVKQVTNLPSYLSHCKLLSQS